jgi:hypothetical protein
MGMCVSIGAGSGLLRAIVTGEFALEEAQRTFLEILEILEAVARHSTDKILLDGRELTGEPTTIQRFLFSAITAHAVMSYRRAHRASRALQFAYVLQEPVLDPQRFGETVAVNRGMWVKVFDNPEDALGWLRDAPANTPAVGDA